MQMLYPLDKLINNVSIMKIFQDLLSNSIMQISLHKLKNQVQIFVVLCLDDSV